MVSCTLSYNTTTSSTLRSPSPPLPSTTAHSMVRDLGMGSNHHLDLGMASNHHLRKVAASLVLAAKRAPDPVGLHMCDTPVLHSLQQTSVQCHETSGIHPQSTGWSPSSWCNSCVTLQVISLHLVDSSLFSPLASAPDHQLAVEDPLR